MGQDHHRPTQILRELGRIIPAVCPQEPTLTKPPANILELPLGQRAEMALKAAVEKVVEEHVRDGRPLYIWRDGKVVEVSAQELREQSTRPQ
jgi:hypothetical protein